MMVDIMAMRDDDYDNDLDIIPEAALALEHCPTCDSPAPLLHPAMQFEGEVQPCKDAWHTQTTNGWDKSALAVVKAGEKHMSALTGIALAMEQIIFGDPHAEFEKLLAREACIQRWRGMESRCQLSRENSMAGENW
jgi:hypothetical protein